MLESISVPEFLKESWEDFHSPTTSTFVGRMGECRNTISMLEETLDNDRSGVNKTKKSIKALYNSGSLHVNNEVLLAESLERLGSNAMSREQESDIGTAFLKFAVVTKELSALMKNLMQNLNNILMFPLDSFMKGDLRGVKGDLKKPFDKAWKDYETKFSKIEKEKKQLAREAGMLRTEVSGAEIAEEMEKERRMFQLQMCEYLIKVNEIKTKKGLDLLQHLVEHYHAQHNFFQDGLKTIEHFRSYIETLVVQLTHIRQRQDQEKRSLVELRDNLRNVMTTYKEQGAPAGTGYSLHQVTGNKAHGYERSGSLLKKSEGKMRKVWQKRRCVVKDGILSISHSDVTKEPVKLNLLTCQVKLVPDDLGKKCFDLISGSTNRTYHFQAEDTKDMEEWMSVLNNAKEAVLLKAFGESDNAETSPINQNLRELCRSIITEVRHLPGNKLCCDCNAPDPEWLSVNLGVLVCLECCGVHREMGVHISRMQSIVIDELGSSQLLLARTVSNQGFNEIMEATLDQSLKPSPASDMEEKRTFIRAKYEKHRYAIKTCSNTDDLQQDLTQAVHSQDIFALLQVYAEDIDLMSPLPDTEHSETAAHLAIIQEDGTSLHLVDFLLQNIASRNLDIATDEGNTVLHMCAIHNQAECMKLVLRLRSGIIDLENKDGLTALDIAREKGHDVCVELLKHALSGKVELFENVVFDWGLIKDDHLYDNVDYSDDELDDKTSERKVRSRPGSLVMTPDMTLPGAGQSPGSARERSSTVDSASSNRLSGGGLPSANKTKGGVIPTLQPTNSTKRKPPAPLPPSVGQFEFGHTRNPSDPSTITLRVHRRSPSEPPPIPPKQVRNLPGATPVLPQHPVSAGPVLPPPPEFRTDRSTEKPKPAPRPDRPPPPNRSSVTNGSSSSIPSVTTTSPSPDNSPRNSVQQPTSDRDSQGEVSVPVPTPRNKRNSDHRKRCRACYDCVADNPDELSFIKGDIILLIKEEEEEWWEGEMENQPGKVGMFPATFVEIIQ